MSCLIRYNPAGSILLPSGYTRLSYIQFTGSLWIDSGTLSTDIDEVYYEVSPDSIPISGDMHIIAGTRSASYNNYKVYGVVQPNGELKMHYGSTVWYSTTKMVVGGRYIIKGILKESQLKLWINGNLEIDKAITGGPTNGVKNTIGAWNGNGSISAEFKGKIYFTRFWKNGLIVRDFVPVQKSDGTIGLLDLVNNTFYGNSGTGTFIAGPECPQGFPTSEYCLVETHSAVTLTSDVIPCYRRSDGKPGKYTLSTNTFTEVLGTIGPSITFGWGEVVNNMGAPLHAIPHNISTGDGRFGINTAFDFSGTNAYLNTDGLTTGKTYMGWFYTASKPAREVFFADDSSGMAFGTYNNGTQAIISTANAFNKVFTLSTWNIGWNHIAVVKSDNGLQLYINGIAQTATSSTDGWTHKGGLWIGARSTFNNNFSGRCQDFKVFDTALTLAQIQQEM